MGFGFEKQPLYFFSELRRGKGMTQKVMGVPGFQKTGSIFTTDYSFISSNQHTGSVHYSLKAQVGGLWAYNNERTCFLPSTYVWPSCT